MLPDRADATIRLGTAPPAAIAHWIGAVDFATYLTACNPCSQQLTDRQNDERLACLRVCLHCGHARLLEGTASIPDEAWSEPSLLVADCSLERIDELALEFEQNAVVLVARDTSARLRVYRGDWRGAITGSVDVDWAID